ncbi:MAG: hypothetical protein KDD64_05815 [Bdellovibrionales bacterium]|nr:hypothetical protein [Bdellovibrionales bacterium]
MKYALILLLLLFSLVSPLYGQEAEITIKDTAGFTRAVSQVEGVGIVEFDLVDAAGLPADGVEVTLTNTVTGESLTVASVNGTATFQGVQSGVWTVASSVSQVTFTNVAIGAGAPLVAGGGLIGGTAASVIGGTAAVGGATAIAVTQIDDNNDDPVLSPSS